MMDHFGVVQTWLINSYNIKVSPEWLSACLEWIAQENGSEMQSGDTVKQQVFEQWLTSDLAEIGEPSLPIEAMSSNKMELIGNYALQIISIVDVGFPFYGQQQKMMGRENMNAEVSADKPFQQAWEPKQSRMLLLTLTDGHSELKAMEYQPIRSLHINLASGTKCVLSGTVLCRRGMVLLTEEHIQLLGGEVDTLTEVNSPLNLLQQAMEKSREDDGKHAKQEFSGKFIIRCPGKKFDLQKKASMIKTQGSCSNFKNSHQLQTVNHTEIKRENKPTISSFGKVKAETIKSEQSGSVFDPGLAHKLEAEEWEDDINYSELFEEDTGFDDGLCSYQNNTDEGGRNNCDKISYGVCNSSLNGMGSYMNKTNITGENIPQIWTEQQISNIEVKDLFDDDEDMEIENVFDTSPSPSLQNISSKRKNSNDPITCREPSWEDKLSMQMVEKNRVKQSNSSQDTKDCYPYIPGQSEDIRDSKPERGSPTFTSPACSTSQGQLRMKKPLFKLEKESSKPDESLVTTSSSQAKKPKVQAKLSDLFRKQSKTCVKAVDEKPADIAGCKSTSDPQSSCPTSAMGNPGDLTLSQSVPMGSPNQESLLLSTSSSEKADVKDAQDRKSQDVPRAVIQPFKPVSNKCLELLSNPLNQSAT
ncbi:hypothetical protein EGW08_001351 [Elysia chlorotica]|uniref:RecQ-mediated genome instability protein 1 n=1 Tax=Elysia chlorotica TaxID=188477 RepID=A0A433UAJ1_ELYCH|nr:hypothetical protein EGW08_001351 [Elysia chlorotica]